MLQHPNIATLVAWVPMMFPSRQDWPSDPRGACDFLRSANQIAGLRSVTSDERIAMNAAVDELEPPRTSTPRFPSPPVQLQAAEFGDVCRWLREVADHLGGGAMMRAHATDIYIAVDRIGFLYDRMMGQRDNNESALSRLKARPAPDPQAEAIARMAHSLERTNDRLAAALVELANPRASKFALGLIEMLVGLLPEMFPDTISEQRADKIRERVAVVIEKMKGANDAQ